MENLKNITPVEDFNWDAYENGKNNIFNKESFGEF